MKYSRFVIPIIVVFCQSYCHNGALAQDSLLYNNPLQEAIEMAAESETDNTEHTEIIEQLNALTQHKLNLNKATVDEMTATFLFTISEAESIAQYRNLHGNFLSFPELLMADGIDSAKLNLVRPYICIEPVTEVKLSRKDIRQQIAIGVGRSFGNAADSANSATAKYPFATLIKYRLKASDKISAGIVCENDRGEAMFGGTNKTFDFVSGHVAITNMRILKNLTVGDYHANFGQGLVMWTGFSMSAMPGAANMLKTNTGIMPNNSTNENRFLRGVASTIKLGAFEVTGFYSQKNIDANIVAFDSVRHHVISVSALQTSGLHVTQSEIADEHALGECILGGHIGANIGRIKMGATYAQTNYNAMVKPALQLYNANTFSGNQSAAGSFDFKLNLGPIKLFGEAAQNNNHAKAFINGLLVQPSTIIAFMFLHRYYNASYFSPYSNAYGTNKKNANEQGFSAALDINPIKSIKLTFFADQSYYPWVKYLLSKPSTSSEYFVQSGITITSALNFNLRYSIRTKEADITDDTIKIKAQQQIETQKYRLQCNYKVVESFEIRSRVEFINYVQAISPAEQGIMFFQDFIWKPQSMPFSLSSRYTLYNTDSYNARMYSYETDMLYAWPIKTYYNRGANIYAMFRWSPFRNFDLHLRWSHDIKPNLPASDYAKLQVVYKF